MRITAKMGKLKRSGVMLAACALSLCGASAVRAATFIVTSTADSGAGTLREAIGFANANEDKDSIQFAPGINEVVLTSGQLVVTRDLDINNANSDMVTIRRSNATGTAQFRILLVAGEPIATLSNLTISNGSANDEIGGGIWNSTSTVNMNNCTVSGNFSSGQYGGGGIYALGGATNLTDCTISGNTASNSGAAYGGGIAGNNLSVVNLTRCTVSGNKAQGGMGGLGGGLYSQGTVNLTNCTISANTASGSGSGIGGGFLNDGGTWNLTNCTISANTASGANNSQGGGIYRLGPVNLKNTIVSGNFATTKPEISDSLTTDDHNIIGGDAKLGPLQDNGGPTQTMALLAGSPAIDAGTDGGAPSTDQRGVARPQGSAVDIGAFEVDTAQAGGSLTVNVTDDDSDGICGVGHCSLREAITGANANADESTIAFDIPGAGPHIIQLDGVLPVLRTIINISNLSGESITVRGEGAADPYRIFFISSGAVNDLPVSISNLIISNGYVTDGFGGGIYNSFGALTLTDCTISGNTATNTSNNGYGNSNGGGIHSFGGSVNLNSCTLSGNVASSRSASYGGALHSQSRANLTNCTISGNTSISTDDGFSLGGGIYNYGSMNLANCTISGNASTARLSQGGGIYGYNSVNLKNTIVSGNTALYYPDVYDNGTLATDDHNLIGGDARLGPLQDNGGPTQTMALRPGSPALDAGTNIGAPPTDQRGVPRPYDQFSIANATDGTDIGAFEAGDITAPPVITFTTPEQDRLFTTASFGTISGTASDEAGGSGLDRVELVIYRRFDNKRWMRNGWRLTGDTPFSTAIGVDGAWSFQSGVMGGLPDGANLLDGNYYFYAYAYDVTGNRSVATLGVSLDARDPLAPVIKHPAANSYIPRFSTVVVSGTASDTVRGSGIVQVELFLQRGTDDYFWNGSAWVAERAALATTLSGGRSWSRRGGWPDSNQAPDGDYKLSARAIDRAGHVSPISTPFTVTVDSIRPTISINAIAAGRTADQLRRITGTSSDNIKVARVTVRLYRYGNGAGISAGYRTAANTWTLPYDASTHELAVTSTSPNFATWRYALPSAAQGLEPGQYMIRATATDVTGWTSYTQTTFTVSAGNGSTPASFVKVATSLEGARLTGHLAGGL